MIAVGFVYLAKGKWIIVYLTMICLQVLSFKDTLRIMRDRLREQSQIQVHWFSPFMGAYGATLDGIPAETP